MLFWYSNDTTDYGQSRVDTTDYGQSRVDTNSSHCILADSVATYVYIDV